MRKDPRHDQDKDSRDVEAVALTIGGDHEAFRLIVERYEPMVRHLAMKYLRDDNQVRDAVQEIFLRAFRSLGTFDPTRRFFPWLYGIAVNELRTVRRRVARRRAIEQPVFQLLLSNGENPEEITIRSEEDRLIRHAVDSLPASLRDVVVLYYLEQLSIDEVSAALDLGRENVKSRLHRARKKLKTLLVSGRNFFDADATGQA